jgi:hypothetical protein
MRDTSRSTVDHIYVDLGTGNTRAGYSSEGGICMGIGNYPRAPEATPSLVPQAPSHIIYEPQEEGAAKPVGFGYAIPRRNPPQEAVKNVKFAILRDREAYDYAYSLLVDASERLRLGSVERVAEDLLRFVVAHAINQCGGQPKKGWVFSVPQCYGISDVQRYRNLIQRAGAEGDVDIHGESDCIMYASMHRIEDFVRDPKEAAFKLHRNLSVTAAVCDLGDGTTVRIIT